MGDENVVCEHHQHEIELRAALAKAGADLQAFAERTEAVYVERTHLRDTLDAIHAVGLAGTQGRCSEREVIERMMRLARAALGSP